MELSKRKPRKIYKVVCVSWGDAFIETDDFTLEEAIKTQPIYRKTVGFLICKNQYGYVLATDLYEKESYGMSAKMFIPKGMITEVKTLTY